MYKDEKLKILDLLSKGLIDSKTAGNILDSLDKNSNDSNGSNSIDNKKFKVLRIQVESSKGDDVNVRIPLEFAKLLKTKSFGFSFDDNNINIDEIIELASSGIVGELINVESANGDTVKITIE